MKRLFLFFLILFWCSAILFAELMWTGCGISKKAYMTELAAAFEKETGIHIELSGGGATKGIRDVNNNLADIGGSCRHLIIHPEESDVSLLIAAWDALVVIVHPDNKISNISHEDLMGVFTGEITNWKQLGGPNHPIEVFIREGMISGVGMMARELIFGNADQEFTSTQEFPSSGPLEKAVVASKWAIAITGISSAKKRDVKVLTLNGVEPSMENLENSNYILSRPLYIVTKNQRSAEVNLFLEYAMSAAGQAVIEAEGTLPATKAKDLLRHYRILMRNVEGSQRGAFE